MFSLIGDISGYSAILPFVVLLVKWKKIPRACLPLSIYIILSLFNELWADVVIRLGHYPLSRPVSNVYVLAEPVLLIWQFRNWKLFVGKTGLYRSILVALALAWITLVVFGTGIHSVTSWYRIVSFFVMTLIALANLHFIFVQNRSDFLRSTNFIVTAACIFFFSYRLVHEMFYMYGLDKDLGFLRDVYVIADLNNLIYTLLLAYALLWTDRKQPYLLRY